MHGKYGFAEVFKNLTLDTDLKIILINYYIKTIMWNVQTDY